MTTLDAANASDRAQLIKMLGMSTSSRKKATKYKSKATYIDGHRFMSKKEGQRYCELMLEQGAGHIRNLTLQPKFELHAPNGKRIGLYIADFKYDERTSLKDWVEVTEDCKGMKTSMFRWKCRHVEAEYNIKLRIT